MERTRSGDLVGAVRLTQLRILFWLPAPLNSVFTPEETSQTVNPLQLARLKRFAAKPIDPKVDLAKKQTDALIAFVNNIPRPQQVLPVEAKARAAVLEGEKIFNETRCNVCHQRKVEDIDGLYSDLLLHDMGQNLEDPVPATSIHSVQVRQNGGYMGASRRLIRWPVESRAKRMENSASLGCC